MKQFGVRKLAHCLRRGCGGQALLGVMDMVFVIPVAVAFILLIINLMSALTLKHQLALAAKIGAEEGAYYWPDRNPAAFQAAAGNAARAALQRMRANASGLSIQADVVWLNARLPAARVTVSSTMPVIGAAAFIPTLSRLQERAVAVLRREQLLAIQCSRSAKRLLWVPIAEPLAAVGQTQPLPTYLLNYGGMPYPGSNSDPSGNYNPTAYVQGCMLGGCTWDTLSEPDSCIAVRAGAGESVDSSSVGVD